MTSLANAYLNVPDPDSPIEIAAVGGRIGAEVRDVRLGADLDDATLAAVRAALVRHKVLFFAGRGISTMPGMRHSASVSARRSRIRQYRAGAAISCSNSIPSSAGAPITGIPMSPLLRPILLPRSCAR